MSHKEDTPIRNISNNNLVVGNVLIEPMMTQMVDATHSENAKYLSQNSKMWEGEPTGGPTGAPVITIGAVVDNKVIIDIQFLNRMEKKHKKQSGIRIHFTSDAAGLLPITTPTITRLLLGALIKPGLYKTTSDGRLSFEVEDLVDEEIYIVFSLGAKAKAISEVIDFNDSVELPTLVSFTSPAANTLRLEGTGFAAMTRLATSFTNGSNYLWPDGAPAEDNAGWGNTLIEWSDTVIEWESVYFPTGTVVATAIQNNGPAYVVVKEWLNSNLEVGGFPPFNVQTTVPKSLTSVDYTGDVITAVGTGFDNSVGLVIEFDDQFFPFIALDYSWSPGYTSESATQLVTVPLTDLFDMYGAQAGTYDITRVWLRDTSSNTDLGSVSAANMAGDATFSNGTYTVYAPKPAPLDITAAYRPTPTSFIIQGTGLNHPDAVRGTVGLSNGSLSFYHPDRQFAAYNAGNGINDMVWTDTQISFSSVYTPTGTALGVAIHMADGNTALDSSSVTVGAP